MGLKNINVAVVDEVKERFVKYTRDKKVNQNEAMDKILRTFFKIKKKR